MNIQQKIESHLDDLNFADAIKLYEQNRITISGMTLFRLAKACYSLYDYENVLRILQKIQPKTPVTLYETKILEFKCKYLLNLQTESLLNQLLNLTSRKPFQTHHTNNILQFKKIVAFKDIQKTKAELKKEGEVFQTLYNKQVNTGVIAYEGFPIFLISKRWFSQWKKYVFLVEHQIERISPGCISQFELLDNFYNVLHDPDRQKQYTNRYLFPTHDYQLLTKQCWLYLSQKYGGVPISRINISNYDKPTETVTEVELRRIIVYRYSRPQERFYIQISRKQPWKKLLLKISRIWGEGRIWKSVKGTPKKINLNIPIEQQDLSNIQILFETKQNKKWPLADLQQVSLQKLQKCSNCNKTQNLKFCQCKLVKYCNMDCLKAHRSEHRKQCQSKKQTETEMNKLLNKYNLNQQQGLSGNKGLVGLRNLGNTCFMNSGLQCLSNTKQITQYFMSNKFLKDLNTTNPIGSGGVLACSYAKLIRQMWSGKQDDISPWQFKKAMSKFAPQFSGFNQHDSQQLISTLLDGLHEDTNLIKVKPSTTTDDTVRSDQQASRISAENYAKRNKSTLCDLTVGQFKSRLVCPKCGKVSIIFQPYTLIPLPIPQNLETKIYILTQNYQQPAHKVTLVISSGDTVQQIADRIQQQFKLSIKNLKFYDLDQNYQVAHDYKLDQPAQRFYRSRQHIFCYEFPQKEEEYDTYRVEYYIEQRGKRQKVTYPRFVKLKKGSKSEKIYDQIYKTLQRFTKNERIKNTKELFEFSMQNNCTIKVLLKYNNLKLATYREYRNDIEGKNAQQLSIANCFDLFTREQKLDKQNAWYCNKCKQSVEATKKMDIYKTNKILLLGMKRFRHGRKLKNKISFPIKSLDLSNYLLSNNQKKQSIIYELYAVSNHYGAIGGGHYTAFCKNFITGKWYQFNDSRISKVNQQQIVSSNAYVLFYRRMD